MEIRGHQYAAIQGSVFIDSASGTEGEVIAGKAGKTLYINYMVISISEWKNQSDYIEIRDGSGGYAFINFEIGANYGQRIYPVDLGEYGYSLTQGNGLFANTTASQDITVTALGYFK